MNSFSIKRDLIDVTYADSKMNEFTLLKCRKINH